MAGCCCWVWGGGLSWAELWAVRADGVEDQDEATAAEWYAEADCLMMVGHVHIDAELLDKCAQHHRAWPAHSS